jgi:large conductance mechanosensitive channel
MWNEFKEFINRGSVMDLAIGVIIGAAFGKIVSSFVDDIISPIIGLFTGGMDLSGLKVVVGSKVEGDKVVEVALKSGSFIQTAIDFLIIAFVIFMMVKAYNNFKKAVPAPGPTPTESLLGEICDLLKAR